MLGKAEVFGVFIVFVLSIFMFILPAGIRSLCADHGSEPQGRQQFLLEQERRELDDTERRLDGLLNSSVT